MLKPRPGKSSPLRIAFIDLSGIDFDVQSPEKVPLGGMQSGLCFLAQALRDRGHRITIFNGTSRETESNGIKVKKFSEQFINKIVDKFDVFISTSCDISAIRPHIQSQPLLLFTGHNSEVPSLQELLDINKRNAWDHFVFKTNWQAESLRRKFGIDPKNISIITNAAAPFFVDCEERSSYFFKEKRPPVIYYSSTPFRGLNVLARSFASIVRELPGTQGVVYSSMKPYHSLASDDEYDGLYELCRQQGMKYVGSLDQRSLAKSIRSADILAFPSTYPETSCITIMEGMLNSSLIITRNLGAIPETCAGFGIMMKEPDNKTPDEVAHQYAKCVVRVAKMAYHDPVGLERHLKNQRMYALANYNWNTKAEEWEQLLERIVQSKRLPQSLIGVGRESPNYNVVQTISGAKLYVGLHDKRAQRLLLCGGSLNPETQAIWQAALTLDKWDLIIDVGANYGEMLTEKEIRDCPLVLAVEPNPLVLPFLKKTLAGYENIEIIDMALSNTDGEGVFSINSDWSGMSSLGSGPNEIGVKLSTVDSLTSKDSISRLAIGSVLMKIDVEGGEYDVLKGATRTIERAAKFCGVIEIGHLPDSHLSSIEQKFDAYGLRLTHMRLEKVRGLNLIRDKKTPFWYQDVIIVRKGDIL